ncbi:MAG: glycosyltransferase family 4 protein [Myxococcales bacterium]|nr:glycosyltransferase family 4 protein [Myxococcales bacterium]
MTPHPLGLARSKIVLITHEFFPYRGGIATWVQEFASAAKAEGWPIEVWCPAAPELHPEKYPFPVVPMPVPGGQGWKSRIALSKFLRQRVATWREAHLLLPDPGPIRTFMDAKLFGLDMPASIRVVLHGTEIIRLARWPWRKKKFWSLLRKAERVAVVSRHNRKLTLDRFPDLPEKVKVAHAAPRSDLAVPRGPVERPWRDKTVILTVARISPRKGQLAMIEAIGRLPSDMRNKIIYRLAGQTNSPSYRDKVESVARRLGVTLEILGKVPDERLPEQYQDADIFALTSREYWGSIEGFGLVYLEAGLFGLPVIAHRTGGVEDAVLDEQTGFLMDPDDRTRLAEAISRLVREPALRARMGARGVTWARSFSWAQTVRDVLED